MKHLQLIAPLIMGALLLGCSSIEAKSRIPASKPEATIALLPIPPPVRNQQISVNITNSPNTTVFISNDGRIDQFQNPNSPILFDGPPSDQAKTLSIGNGAVVNNKSQPTVSSTAETSDTVAASVAGGLISAAGVVISALLMRKKPPT